MMSHRVFVRPQGAELLRRLKEPRRFLQVVAGARQVGKTTMVRQITRQSGLPAHFASADGPMLQGPEWIEAQWEAARLLVDPPWPTKSRRPGRVVRKGALLVLDEVQKVSGWSEMVKRLWDADTRNEIPLRVVVLGSAPLLVRRGLGESLTGRFEVLHLPHWSFPEMKEAFGWSLDQYLFYGAYPGAAPLIGRPNRWARYILDSLVEPTISRDVLLLSRVDKPALLRRLFQLGCSYSGQILSYTGMLGQLQDAGNTTTLAHYLDLLAGVGMMVGLQKYSNAPVRRRGSSPKLQILNTALMTAACGLTLKEARMDGQYWGRLVESAVGAHLANASAGGTIEVYYWRHRSREVDFVVRAGRGVAAIEVKSGKRRDSLPGMAAFDAAFQPGRKLLVGGDGIELEQFLSRPVEHWVRY